MKNKRRSPATPTPECVTQSSLADNLTQWLLTNHESTVSSITAATGRGIDLERMRRDEQEERDKRDRHERLAQNFDANVSQLFKYEMFPN